MFASSSLLTALVLAGSVLVHAKPTIRMAGELSLPEQANLFKRISSTCSGNLQTSCHNTTKQTDTCCFETPGGLLLQTQFWDTDPATGPANSWTIHGLWPDNCDGTFTENCDSSRDYTGISSLLTAQGASDTLAFMNEFWINDPDDGTNEEFWEHEWATHGTCYSTLETSCLPSGSPKGAEAVAFFETVVELFKTLPTYDWLAQSGILPSDSATYTLSALNSALESASGVTPALQCDGSTLDAIEWYFNLQGSIIDGTFIAIDSPDDSTCPSSGIKYPTKKGSGVTTTTSGTVTATTTRTSTSSSPTSSSGALPSKATLAAINSSGSKVGGILTGGTLSAQTPGTMTLSGTTSSFTMKSSKGLCAIQSSELVCSSSISSGTAFSAVTSGSNLLLSVSGSTSFSSSALPSGDDQETVFTGSSKSQTFTIEIVST